MYECMYEQERKSEGDLCVCVDWVYHNRSEDNLGCLSFHWHRVSCLPLWLPGWLSYKHPVSASLIIVAVLGWQTCAATSSFVYGSKLRSSSLCNRQKYWKDSSLKINQLNKPMEKCSASLVTKEIRFKPLQVTASCLEKWLWSQRAVGKRMWYDWSALSCWNLAGRNAKCWWKKWKWFGSS